MKFNTIFAGLVSKPLKITLLIFFLFFVQQETKSQKKEFLYNTNKKDYFLLPIAAAIHYGAEITYDNMTLSLTVEEIEKLDRNNVNSFDRGAIDNWDRNANNISDITSKTLLFFPAIFFIPQIYYKQWGNILTLGVMYLETYYFTKGLTALGKILVPRIRPYCYNTSFTAEERYNFQINDEAPNGKTSSFSGHTSRAFASAVFLSKAYTDIYGKNTLSYIIWGSSLTIASYSGYCRVKAGEHFTTDVISGAILGSAIGYFIPVLHNNKYEKASLSVLPNSFSFVYKF